MTYSGSTESTKEYGIFAFSPLKKCHANKTIEARKREKEKQEAKK